MMEKEMPDGMIPFVEGFLEGYYDEKPLEAPPDMEALMDATETAFKEMYKSPAECAKELALMYNIKQETTR